MKIRQRLIRVNCDMLRSLCVLACKCGVFMALVVFAGCLPERSVSRHIPTEYEFLKYVEETTLGAEESGTPQDQGGELTSNRFENVESAYVRGRQNAMRVLEKVGESPISCGYYTGVNPLGNDSFQRAYVYGWYYACLDYFAAKLQHGDEDYETLRSYLFYRRTLDDFKRSESGWLPSASGAIHK